MPLYFSSHTTACMTRQALRRLILELLADPEVKVRRCVCGQIGGRMITEVEAPDQPTLQKWFGRRNVNIEWMMRVDLDGADGTVQEY